MCKFSYKRNLSCRLVLERKYLSLPVVVWEFSRCSYCSGKFNFYWQCLQCLQYNKEARDTQDLLKRMETEVNQKYSPEFKDMYQMDGLIRELDVSLQLFKKKTILQFVLFSIMFFFIRVSF